jgi:hypothetical protein
MLMSSPQSILALLPCPGVHRPAFTSCRPVTSDSSAPAV